MAQQFKARKLSYAELSARYEDASRQASLLSIALQCASVECADARTSATEDHDPTLRYTFSAFRVRGASGGVLLTAFECPGQAVTIRADYLDDVFARVLDMPSWMLSAIGSLQTAVRKIQAGA